MFSNHPPRTPIPPGSVYQRVLGEGFADLDPRLRTYFGPLPRGGEGVGTGRYDVAGLRWRALRPVFALLARAGMAFPERGHNVPFGVRNVPSGDGTLSAVRTFVFPGRTRVIEDTMRIEDGRLIDAVGRRRRLEIELDVSAIDGKLRMTSTRLWLRCGSARIPLPRFVTIELEESVAAPERRAQRVDLRMRMPLLGDVFGYAGEFTYTHKVSAASTR